MPRKIDKLVDLIEQALDEFHGSMSGIQDDLLEKIIERLKDLKLKGGRIAPAVENLRILSDIRSQIQNVVNSTGFVSSLQDFVTVFDQINKTQSAFFKSIDETFAPSKFLKEMQKQMISQTVDQLSSAGIGVSLSDEITDILRHNITTGSSYKSLTAQLETNILNGETDGSLLRYAKQITVDSVNQYSAQSLKVISSDLNYEWFRYAGADIKTTRPFCDAMTDLEYFHISEVPELLRATYLYYSKKGVVTKVPIYDKTGLPHGMIEGTDTSNFFVRRGGYNCGHQIFPTIERIVPQSAKDRVSLLPAFQRWQSTHQKKVA